MIWLPYGQVIFDDVIIYSAVSFESVAKACKAKYVLGLSATLTQKMGTILLFLCGAAPFATKSAPNSRL